MQAHPDRLLAAIVTFHEVRRIGLEPPETVCAQWLKQKESAR